MPEKTQHFRLYCLLVAGILSFFMGWGLLSADLLGVKHDEAWPLGVAIEGARQIKSGDWSVFSPSQWMRYDYAGVFKDYVLIPFCLVFTGSVFLMRVVWLCLAAFGMIFLFLVTGRWFGWLEGVLCVALLGTNSTFIRAARAAAAREEVFMNIFLWVAAYLFIKSVWGNKKSWWSAAWLVCGFAFWVKVVFGIYLVCGLVFLLIFWWDRVRYVFLKSRVALAFVCFAVGSIALWTVNLRNGFFTFELLDAGLERAVGNNFFTLLSDRSADLGMMLLGALSLDYSFPQVYDFPGLVLFILSVACCIGWCVCGRLTGIKRRAVLTLVFFWTGVFLFTFVPPAWTRSEQMIVLITFPALIGAVFCGYVFKNFSTLSRVFVALLLVTYVVVQQICLLEVDRRLSSTAFADSYPGAMRVCARYLQGNRIDTVVCNANIRYQLTANTGGRVNERIMWWCPIIVAQSWGYWIEFGDNPDFDNWNYWRNLVEEQTQDGRTMYVLDMFPVPFWKKMSPYLAPNGYGYALEKTFWEGFAPVRLYRVWKLGEDSGKRKVA